MLVVEHQKRFFDKYSEIMASKTLQTKSIAENPFKEGRIPTNAKLQENVSSSKYSNNFSVFNADIGLSTTGKLMLALRQSRLWHFWFRWRHFCMEVFLRYSTVCHSVSYVSYLQAHSALILVFFGSTRKTTIFSGAN